MAKRKKMKPSVQPQSDPRVVYTEDMAASICEQVANGLALKEVCIGAAMPSRSAVYKWFCQHPAFADMYARAREERADLIADEIVTIADTEADASKARVRIDARKWWAAKVNPKRYGERITADVNTSNYVISDKPMTPEEWEAKYCLAAPGGSAENTH
jgi:hypothetical protein